MLYYTSIIIYGAYGENARFKLMYTEKYPEQNQPSRWMFHRLC